MTDKATETASSPLFPIREVSRLTGVNSVTLRAWERRYGLIEPRRTPKGHRLYAREDIERIEHILQWLNRGVPVSQVRELLDQPQPESTPMPDEGSWSGQQQLALAAIDAQDEARLAELYNQSLALYPVSSVVERLWRPLLEQLEERGTATFGTRLAQCFFESFLRSRIGARLVFANQERHAPHITLTRLPEEPGPDFGYSCVCSNSLLISSTTSNLSSSSILPSLSFRLLPSFYIVVETKCLLAI